MAQSMKRTKILGEPGAFFDAVDSLVDVDTLPPFPSRKDIRRMLHTRMLFENLPRVGVQRDDVVDAALGVHKVAKAAFEINMIPLQAEQFAAPHAGKQRQAYCYRDKEFFRLRIMGNHESQSAQTG